MSGTVFILACDDELFLERAVRSAAANAWLTIWVVIDPRSTDDTQLVARELSRLARVQCTDSLGTAVASTASDWWILHGARDQLLPFAASRLPPSAGAYVGLTERPPRPAGPTPASTWWRGNPARALVFANDEDAFWSALSGSSLVWEPATLARSTAWSPRRPEPPPAEQLGGRLISLEAAVTGLQLALNDDVRAVFQAGIASTLDEMESLIPSVTLARQLQVIERVRRLLSVAHRSGLARLDTVLDSHTGRLSTVARAQRSLLKRLGPTIRGLSRSLLRR